VPELTWQGSFVTARSVSDDGLDPARGGIGLVERPSFDHQSIVAALQSLYAFFGVCRTGSHLDASLP
jgi:hypothetical protein